MIFSSNVFFFVFFPLVLLLYYIAPRRLRNPILLLFSLIFYGWGEPAYSLLMIATILLDFACGLLIGKFRGTKWAKIALVGGVVLNLASLCFFKYTTFFVEQFNAIAFLPDLPVPEIRLPIGISFYVFQSMSYIVDVYRQDAPVQKNVLSFGTYVTLFPQLIAGPIVRYADVAEQLDNRQENIADFSSGVLLFIVGLCKKMLLANPMGNLWANIHTQSGTAAAWFSVIAYSLQIYFDFAGYSDMARGLGRMFGFEFLPNFNYPYISKSITEFWRRWHISLSTWFKEYLYIPLGGNRRGKLRQIFNILIVWAATGFWHGASWNFLLWGLYYAVLLIVEKFFLKKWLEKLPAVLQHIYALLIVMLGWALFSVEDLGELGAFLLRLFRPEGTGTYALNQILGFAPLMAAAIIGATPLGKALNDRFCGHKVWRYAKLVLAALGLTLCVAALASQSYNPFIYSRF